MKLIVGNMVCSRCVLAVERILNELGLANTYVSIGQINFSEEITSEKKEEIRQLLVEVGFELIEDRVESIIQNVKSRVLSYLDNQGNGKTLKMSSYITDEVYYEYSYLSDLFSKTENKTIEQYFIELRIDRAKEQLKYSGKSLSEIAFDLGFSSPQHFANQFKHYTGLAPRAFRKLHTTSLIKI